MQNQENREIISGAEALMRALVAEGVDLVFGYPGGAILPVYDALYDYQDRLHHILVRHEQGAIHAAEGYARATNRPGVAIVTSGPGVANVITGLADAVMDSTPVVVISGQVGNAMLGSDAFQETDVVGITHPITKWALQVRNAEDIPAAVAKAFYIARTGRPGPVVLDISKDAQVGKLEWHYEPTRFIRSYNPRPKLKQANIEKAAEMLNNAERPLILAGHGIMISEAEEELKALAEKAGIPVATTLLGLSTLPSSHPLNKGMLGMHGNIGPNYLTNQADVILAIGMRFDDRVTLDTNRYARQAKKIHIDIDRSEFHRHVPVDLKIHADAKDALQALLPLVKPNAHHAWSERFDICNRAEDKLVKDTELHHDGPLTMGEVAAAITRATDDEAVLVTDVGQNQMMSARYFRYERPRSIITSGGRWHHGLRPASSHRGQDGRTRPHGSVLRWRRRLPDDHAGAGHYHAVWASREDGCLRQCLPGQCAPVAGVVLPQPLLANSDGQSRLQLACPGLWHRHRDGGGSQGSGRSRKANARPRRAFPVGGQD